MERVSNSSIYFDWACHLWNWASFETICGAGLDRSTEEGIKQASKHFQQAAGIFEYIQNNIISHIRGSPISCLSNDVLKFSKNLSLAQASLCFYEKAIRDKKPAIIAKLAAQTSLYYSATSASCRAAVLTANIDPTWANNAEFHTTLLSGATEYWQSQVKK